MRKAAVIGSGLAGSLICNALANHFKVFLLEAGPENRVTYPKIDFQAKEFGSVKTLCVGSGGTTNLWHNGLIPLNIDDLHHAEFKEILNDSKRFTDYAASNLYFGKNSYTSEFKSFLKNIKNRVKDLDLFSDGLDCLIYPKKFERLRICKNVESAYNVSDIEFVIENAQLKSITYFRGTKRNNIKCDIAILCAGALGTPYLVKKILSTNGRSAKVCGTGFIDHPMGFVGKVKVKKGFSAIFHRFSKEDRGDYDAHTAIRLKSDCGKYTCCAFFRPSVTMENRLSIYKYKSLLGASKGIERLKSVFSLKLLHPDILAEIYSHLFGVNIRSRIYNILMIFEQKRGTNSVSYDGNKIVVDWRITEDELAVYNSLLIKLRKMLEKVSDELIIKTPITGDWLWSAAHHSGTIPLGPGPDGLIDKNLKLNALDNVYVCDGSVIQEHSYANTGLTIGQLALRLSEHVRSANF